ncbi:MAG: hypothetical protein V1723_01380 [Candidatus Uhrbacteria bacterium]
MDITQTIMKIAADKRTRAGSIAIRTAALAAGFAYAFRAVTVSPIAPPRGGVLRLYPSR